MELELIEPSLYLRMDERAPERFAHALHERVLVRKRSVGKDRRVAHPFVMSSDIASPARTETSLTARNS